MRDKIALEEHISTETRYALWDDAGEASRNGKKYMSCVEDRLLDVGKRIEDMDEYGIALTILSMTSPGIQGIIEPDVAISSAKATNEAIHGTFVEPHPVRFACFACAPLQDPKAAADELERAVVEL